MNVNRTPGLDAEPAEARPPSHDRTSKSNPPPRVSRVSWAAVTVWAFIGLYLLYFGVMTVRQHDAFQTTAFDLGNVDQAVWNTRHGRPFHMTNIEGLTNRLGTHVEPILLPISLIYFVWGDPRALLLLQTLVIGLGAWAVYLVVNWYGDRLTSREPGTGGFGKLSAEVMGVIFALVYLLFPALQSANVFDFHAVALAPTFFLFAFYFLEKEQWGWYALLAVLTMSCKEDMPLMIAMLGLYALVVRRQWKVGLTTIAVAAAWFLLAVGVIMPYFDTRGVSPLANRYAYLGDSPLEMAATILTRPGVVLAQLRDAGALSYLRDLLAPVAYLSLLAPQVLMLGLPPLMVNLLSTDGFMHQLEGFHYGATLAPVVVISAAYGVAWLSHRLSRIRALPYLLAAVVLSSSLYYHRDHGYTPLAVDYRGLWPAVANHHRLGQEMARDIPTAASLAALPHPNPHASQREQLYMIDRVENGQLAPLHSAEYVWLDVTNGWPLHPNDLKAGVENLLAGTAPEEPAYGVEEAADGWLLLRRGAPDTALPGAFYDFARAAEPQPQYALRLQFLLDDAPSGEAAPALESLGFDLHRDPRTGSHRLTFYWRALQPLHPDLRLYPFYFDDTTGEILEDTSLRPMIATVWYPPERWQVGEIVQTSTLSWDVGTDFSVGLGVVQGYDWENVEQRLPIRVEASGEGNEPVVRLFEDDTWARLLQVQGGEPVEEYRTFAVPVPQHPLDVDFGPVRLIGYDLKRIADHELHLALYWQAQTRMDTSYTVFAQVLDPAGQVRAQVDSVPRDGGYPTTWWLPGEILTDPLIMELPPDATQDTAYRLIVGLYDPVTGERLAILGGATDSAKTGADSVQLQSLEP